MITRRHFFRSIGGLSALGVSTAAYGVGVEPVLRLRVTRYHPTPRQWPADFPLKIAVIADIHACDPWMSLERIDSIVERTNALNADIIVLLGDYVAGLHQVTRIIPANEWAKVLAGLKAPLGVHAVMGNHDYWADRTVQQVGHGPTVAHRALEAAGIPVYENDVVRLAKDGPARSGSLASAISSPFCRRAASGARGASALTISTRRLPRPPTMRRSSCSRMSPISRRACPPASRCNCPATPMAARSACSAGRRQFRGSMACGSPMVTSGSNATSSFPAASVAALCRSASACRRRSSR
ncbi:hypothetical protein ACVWWO_003747 [Bradyrhizobium sp. F1.13.1]